MQVLNQATGLRDEVHALLAELGVARSLYTYDGPGALQAHSPINGEALGELRQHGAQDVALAAQEAHSAFLQWRLVPAPRRGELVRLLGMQARQYKVQLGRLISLEVGKILAEGVGEVQEMVDICDLAVGQSRQLQGVTIATERVEHRMMETWHPMGVCGVITAFNFPVGVWSWNTALALVCGNSMLWKPSEKTPLTSLALHAMLARAMAQFGPDAPAGLSHMLVGGREIGEAIASDQRVPLVSATGSIAMGRAVFQQLARRFARPILELGGNNAAIVAPSADLDQALRSIAFAALGTAGQRCTTLRRLFVHASVYDKLMPKLMRVYESVQVGNPLRESTLVGPLIDGAAYQGMARALDDARASGGKVHGGGRLHAGEAADAFYVRPALVEMPSQDGPMLHETFAPILYVMRFEHFSDAIALQNDVSAGLSSALYTLDMREAELFLSAAGSDCGVANVNIGPSGAEIGGAFGGEKESGGGREAGSDAWKSYMRRATNTLNYGRGLPLAQGVSFPVGEEAAAP